MASKALKLRMKAAESKLAEESASVVTTTKREQEHAANAANLMPENHDLLEVPPEKAVLAHYPPGCHVLFTNTSVVPLVVSRGKITAVFVDLSPAKLSRDYCYKILLQNKQKSVIYAREEELQWAPQCPVWMKPSLLQETQGCEWKQALIVGSYQAMGANTAPLYSVQGLDTGHALFHGVEKTSIRYRDNATEKQEVAPPPIKSESPNKNETKPPPPSNKTVASSAALMPFTSTAALHNMKTPAPKKQDNGVSRVTSSPRKRKSSDTVVDSYDAMGRCIAEFRMPYWMKGACLNDAVINQVCRAADTCTACRVVVLESSLPPGKNKGASSTPLVGQSIFVYGRDMQAVEHACELCADLLKEYVLKKRKKKKLVAELAKGWTKINYERVTNAKTTSPGVWRESNGALANKKAKLTHSPSSEEEEEGEIPTPPKQVAESTSKTLFQKPRTVSEDNKENQCVENPIEQVSSAQEVLPATLEPQTCALRSGVEDKNAMEPTAEQAREPATVPPMELVAEPVAAAPPTELPMYSSNETGPTCAKPAAEQAIELVAEPVAVPPKELVGKPVAVPPMEPVTELAAKLVTEPVAQPATELVAEPVALPRPTELCACSSIETGPTGIKPATVKRSFRVPQFANEHYVKDALIGENEKNRQAARRETGCDVQLKFPEATMLPLAPVKVILTGASDADLDYAQRCAENRIVSTVPEDQRGRMLYYLAKDNDYGTCEGAARCQRSPFDMKTWSWMCVVELPHEFDKLHGLFVDKGGSAMKGISRKTGCSHIHLSESLPKHVLLLSNNLEGVNAALKSVHDRVLWVLRESKKRNKCW